MKKKLLLQNGELFDPPATATLRVQPSLALLEEKHLLSLGSWEQQLGTEERREFCFGSGDHGFVGLLALLPVMVFGWGLKFFEVTMFIFSFFFFFN